MGDKGDGPTKRGGVPGAATGKEEGGEGTGMGLRALELAGALVFLSCPVTGTVPTSSTPILMWEERKEKNDGEEIGKIVMNNKE